MDESSRSLRSVTALADVVFTPSDEGGLPRPIEAPTQSIVFRFRDGELAEAGVVAILDVPGESEIRPGMSARARVVFPDAPPAESFSDRSFELWLGHPVGTARIVELEHDERL